MEEIICYTTAPEAYDGFGTRTLEEVVGYDREKPIRKIAVQKQHYGWQEARNGSGMFPLFTEQKFAEFVKAGLCSKEPRK